MIGMAASATSTRRRLKYSINSHRVQGFLMQPGHQRRPILVLIQITAPRILRGGVSTRHGTAQRFLQAFLGIAGFTDGDANPPVFGTSVMAKPDRIERTVFRRPCRPVNPDAILRPLVSEAGLYLQVCEFAEILGNPITQRRQKLPHDFVSCFRPSFGHGDGRPYVVVVGQNEVLHFLAFARRRHGSSECLVAEGLDLAQKPAQTVNVASLATLSKPVGQCGRNPHFLESVPALRRTGGIGHDREALFPTPKLLFADTPIRRTLAVGRKGRPGGSDLCTGP